MKTKLIGSAGTKEQLLEGAKKYWYSPNIVFNDDGTVSNAKGIILGVVWKLKAKRYRLERTIA